MGFTLFFKNRLRNLAKSTPPAVSNTKAKSPSPSIKSVFGSRNFSACIWVAIVIPKKMVIKFASTFCAVSEREFNTPHSRSRFPNIRKPISETDSGATMPATTVITMGKSIFVSFDTFLSWYGILISRSFLVVSSFITGG